MKKYSVYEIEKLTDGKFSKYKLTRAIESGELPAEKHGEGRQGRGVPKYYVLEKDLETYIGTINDDEHKKKKVLGKHYQVTDKEPVSEKIDDLVKNTKHLIDSQREELTILKEQISFLEKKQSTIKQASESGKSDQHADTWAQKRREIVFDLASLGTFSIRKRQRLLQELIKII